LAPPWANPYCWDLKTDSFLDYLASATLALCGSAVPDRDEKVALQEEGLACCQVGFGPLLRVTVEFENLGCVTEEATEVFCRPRAVEIFLIYLARER
jgi:hypothetical protein